MMLSDGPIENLILTGIMGALLALFFWKKEKFRN